MTGAPIAVEADASALAALDLMFDHGIRHLPVIDAERRVIGVVGFSDLRAALPIPLSLSSPPASSERAELRGDRVSDVMSDAPITIGALEPLEDAARLMLEHRIGCLPVVDAEGRIDGILSETDLLQALLTALWTERHGEGG
jgi:acetoin utilization protein AcuB